MAFILFLTAILLLRAMPPLFNDSKPQLGWGFSFTFMVMQPVYCAVLHTVTKQQVG